MAAMKVAIKKAPRKEALPKNPLARVGRENQE